MEPACIPERGASISARRIAAGDVSSERCVEALLARVDAIEPRLHAFAHLDRGQVIAQARAADRRRAAYQGTGALLGVPVALKDVIDTADMPTENGTVLHAGRTPARDATLVRRLREAGAVLFGKTVTTELATYAPGPTRNPHRLDHTPGGSSSGSAAAVAAGLVPLAVGTQTNGSVIRPASFCGVYGFKPTYGLISRAGVLVQSPALDQIGVFANDLGDAALLAQALIGSDDADPATAARPAPPLVALADAEPALAPRCAVMRPPYWERIDADARQAFDGLAARLGEHAVALPWPEPAARAIDWHRTLMEADIAASFGDLYERGRDRLSASLRGQIERGRQVRAVDYRRALDAIAEVNAAFDAVFDRCDAIVTPATLGTAPAGLETTGNPILCTPWTFAGMPALSLPLLRGADGLPLGVQLVGRRHDDARLLRTARWLERLP